MGKHDISLMSLALRPHYILNSDFQARTARSNQYVPKQNQPIRIDMVILNMILKVITFLAQR